MYNIFKYDTTNVAITGISGGGKTNFLTSLLWHLDVYDSGSDKFKLRTNLELSGINLGNLPRNSWFIQKLLSILPKKWLLGRLGRFLQSLQTRPRNNFPYKANRANLTEVNTWAEKTTDVTEFTVEFARSDWKCWKYWKSRKQRIRFFDFPGERFADSAIMLCPSYADWSDYILDRFDENPAMKKTIQPYMNVCKAVTKDPNDYLTAYKRFLVQQIPDYEPLITPSTFRLDQHGKLLEKRVPEGFTYQTQKQLIDKLAEVGVAGFEGHNGFLEEFSPLPVQMRSQNLNIAQLFDTHYTNYRNKVVLPLFNEIFKSSKLLILIDIPSILLGGDKRFNGNQQIVLDLLSALDPESVLGKQLYHLLTWSKPLQDVAFVASKADMVHWDDVEDDKLSQLLRQMFTNVSNKFSFNFEWYCCAAIRSSKKGNAPNQMIGMLADNPDRLVTAYTVSPLPDQVPGKFDLGDFDYYDLYPDVANAFIHPPKHYNLDKIFDEFILG